MAGRRWQCALGPGIPARGYCALEYPARLAHCQRVLAVPFKRTGSRPVEYLEHEEIEAILGVVDRHTVDGRRDYALLATMFNTGARVQEIVVLSVADLRLDAPAQVRLHGKGRKEHVCPLWPQTADLLRALLAERRSRAAIRRTRLSQSPRNPADTDSASATCCRSTASARRPPCRPCAPSASIPTACATARRCGRRSRRLAPTTRAATGPALWRTDASVSGMARGALRADSRPFDGAPAAFVTDGGGPIAARAARRAVLDPIRAKPIPLGAQRCPRCAADSTHCQALGLAQGSGTARSLALYDALMPSVSDDPIDVIGPAGRLSRDVDWSQPVHSISEPRCAINVACA